jgi:hypothetical protein
MGLLDEAIREHLELKRRRGADPAEVAREQREALDPITAPATPSDPDLATEEHALAAESPTPDGGSAAAMDRGLSREPDGEGGPVATGSSDATVAAGHTEPEETAEIDMNVVLAEEHLGTPAREPETELLDTSEPHGEHLGGVSEQEALRFEQAPSDSPVEP